jgi:anthranilate synthase component 2|tara:strand:- start:86 stop:652 length:567 start_codon:yes stop_codon:yes gene_type:complete
MKVLLIDNYDSFTYNLFHYISKFNCKVDVVRNDKIRSQDIIKNKYKKIVISPGPGNPSQAGNCLKIVEDIHKDFPILGVCLGHQIIGQAFGSKIIRAKKIMHGKMSKIYFKKVGVFRNIKLPFNATRYHSLIIDKNNLPDCLNITAETKDKTIMGIKHNKYELYGVQFHPESINTKVGMQIIKNYIDI